MKKILLIISMTILTITVKSQEKISFGATGGINLSNLTSKGFLDNSSKTGFHIGLLAEIPFGDKFSIQPEVLYSRQGGKIKDILIGIPQTYSFDFSLDYIQVPILAKIYLVKKLSLEVGPTFNFLLNDKETGDITTLYTTNFAKNFEFGGVIGTSYKLNNGLFINGKYIRGFSTSFDYNGSVKSNVFQLGVGFFF